MVLTSEMNEKTNSNAHLHTSRSSFFKICLFISKAFCLPKLNRNYENCSTNAFVEMFTQIFNTEENVDVNNGNL